MRAGPYRAPGADSLLGGVRKAYASKGDDCTLTRFVKIEGTRRHVHRQSKLPGMEADYIRDGHTKFPTRVLQPSEQSHLLTSGHSNVKIGRDVRKGKLKGYWIYYLSLEERKTCPSSCQHWQSCYGNNMPFAKRLDHTDPDFLPLLANELAYLCALRRGILVRLHALGDFYSEAYVQFWIDAMARHPNLAIYGYTAHPPAARISSRLRWLNAELPDRCMIRWSNGGLPEMSTVSIGTEASRPANAFICPEQTAKTTCCATCGACWSTRKNVAFLEH